MLFCFNLNELNVFKSRVTLNVFFSFVCIKPLLNTIHRIKIA